MKSLELLPKRFLEMTEEEFKEFVKDSAMDRITLSMWRRNILSLA